MDNEDSSDPKQSLLISSKNSTGVGFDILKALEGIESEYELKRINPNLYRLTIDQPQELIQERFSNFRTQID